MPLDSFIATDAFAIARVIKALAEGVKDAGGSPDLDLELLCQKEMKHAVGRLVASRMFQVCYEDSLSIVEGGLEEALSFVASLPDLKGGGWPVLTEYKTEPIFLPSSVVKLKFLKFYRGFEAQRDVQKVLDSTGLRFASFEQLALFLHGLADDSNDLVFSKELQPVEEKNGSTTSLIVADHHWKDADQYWKPVEFKKVFYIPDGKVRALKTFYKLSPIDHQRLEKDRPDNRTFVVAVDK